MKACDKMWSFVLKHDTPPPKTNNAQKTGRSGESLVLGVRETTVELTAAESKKLFLGKKIVFFRKVVVFLLKMLCLAEKAAYICPGETET